MSTIENSQINKYLSDVCSYIKYKECHKEIKEELSSHIYEMSDEYIEEGLSEEEAIKISIDHMGTPEEVGKRLNVAHKGTPDWVTLLLTICCINMGVILMYLIQKYMYNDLSIFHKSIQYSILGTVSIVSLYYFDYRKIKKYSIHIFAATTLLSFFIILKGDTILGGSVLEVFGFSFKFMEITPFLFLIALAGIFSNWDWNDKRNLFISIIFLGIPLYILMITPSLASCMIYFVGFMMIALQSGLKRKYALFTIMGIVIIGMILIWTKPYRMQRLLAFLNFASDPLGVGFLNMQIHKNMHMAKLFGRGFSVPKGTFPYDPINEFILNYILYAFGWIGMIFIVSLVSTYLIRMIFMIKRIHDPYGKLLISGLISIFTVECVWNILMNVNCIGLAGIPLPFMSYGGSSSLFHAISVGLILSVYRRRSLSFPVSNKINE
ncbi:FtsW/RodA/SpoVE family cell cycle protein [Inediibacterium massiliense]|uniref:FtsW/RodA/SpoVE family cell cycle protein n=1 Tax=Inediibacterium massiliense TaxID=1658111 RepID=UPI0006B5E121|nr:FtsW/RodA/SpoVE family cell cycle protein [Inediibacterium massiliense]